MLGIDLREENGMLKKIERRRPRPVGHMIVAGLSAVAFLVAGYSPYSVFAKQIRHIN